jgi:REP element-mobilizing transposase RayT
VHVVRRAANRTGLLADHGLAREVFAIVERSEETVAACLMPDCLHWVLRDASVMEREMRRLASLSANGAWRRGHPGKLWARSWRHRVVRRGDDVLAIVAYLMFQPVRAGLVADPATYPYVVWRPSG